MHLNGGRCSPNRSCKFYAKQEKSYAALVSISADTQLSRVLTSSNRYNDDIAAGLKVRSARLLIKRLQSGGAMYNNLKLSGRLISTKRQAPNSRLFVA